MTVLLAVKQDNQLILASDRQVTKQWHLTGEICKTFKKRGFIFAGSGGLREIQLVMNKLTVPPMNEDHEMDGYVFEIVEAMRNIFIGYDKECKRMNAEFLLIHKDGIYSIDSNWCYLKSDNLLVKGSGEDVALGAYKALEGFVDDTVERCKRTIEIVNENTLYCGHGVDVEVIELP